MRRDRREYDCLIRNERRDDDRRMRNNERALEQPRIFAMSADSGGRKQGGSGHSGGKRQKGGQGEK
jgi:hypothetical protein